MKKISIILSLLISISCFANEKGNGGNTIKCKGLPMLTLDFYHASLPSVGGRAPRLIDVEKEGLFSHIVEIFKKYDQGEDEKPNLYQWFLKSMQIVPHPNYWIDSELKLTQDQNLIYKLPKGCTLHQAAVRQFGAQYGDSSIISQLSTGQLNVLRVHEILYYIMIATNPKIYDSSPIRNLLRVLLNIDSTDYEIAVAVKFFKLKLRHNYVNWVCSGKYYLLSKDTNFIFKNRDGRLEELYNFEGFGRNPIEAFNDFSEPMAKDQRENNKYTYVLPCHHVKRNENGDAFCSEVATLKNSCVKIK